MDSGENVAGSADGGSLILVSHYLKDQSFKNASGPSGLAPRRQVDLGCDLATRGTDAGHFEVALKLRAQSNDAGTPVFALELTYAGLFRLQNIPAAAVQSALLVEAPSVLFGYAREIVDGIIQKGGMPPLKLAAMDFGALYQADTGIAPAKNITVVTTPCWWRKSRKSVNSSPPASIARRSALRCTANWKRPA